MEINIPFFYLRTSRKHSLYECELLGGIVGFAKDREFLWLVLFYQGFKIKQYDQVF